MARTPVFLELDLAHGLQETPPADPVAALRSRGTPVLADVIDHLREAAESSDVAGLLVHVGGEVLTAAQVEELGSAIEAFGAAGKRTVCWAEAFGETGNGTLGYHLAAHCDEIWLQPTGAVALVGTAASGLFLAGALGKLGVKPEIRARKEYKNAPDMFLREAMGAPQREALQRMTDSITEQVIATVARKRGLDPEAVRAAIASAPLSAQESIDHQLVDHLGYRDEVYAAARRAVAGPGHETTLVDDLPAVKLRYVHRWSAPRAQKIKQRLEREAGRRVRQATRRKRPGVVAVVPVEGGIMLGRSGGSPVSGATAGSDTILSALRQAGRSDDVAAIVLRVVSPGGSYIASDAVHHEVLRLRDGGIPVVASMGTVAASGGYFVAMGTDEIFALPGTITGSIGVFGGKMVVSEAMKKVGISRELVETGEQSTMWADSRPFSAGELERLDAWLDEVYADFTGKAAEGRSLPIGTLEPLARGRVWTGADALERGLVDRLGGLEAAVTAAAERAGRKRAAVRVRRFPESSLVTQLRPPRSSDSPGAAVRPSLARVADAALLGAGPERLLAELSTALGVGPGALRLPGGWSLR